MIMQLQTAASSNKHFETLITILIANTSAIMGLIVWTGKNVNKARTHMHRQNWRINILWQERLEGHGMSEDPIEKELFGEIKR